MHRGETPLSPEELRARAADKDAVIVLLPDRIDRALLDAAPRLKIVANVAVGYDNLDVRHARAEGRDLHEHAGRPDRRHRRSHVGA